MHWTDANTTMTHTALTYNIAFFIFPGFQIQDLSGPLAAFEVAGASYKRLVVSITGGLIKSSCGLEVMTTAISPADYDTLIIAGGNVPADLSELLAVAKQLAPVLRQDIRRIASVCTGAFILAAAGRLDGRKATTHWKYTAQLQQLFPRVKVDGDRIYTRDRGVWTSAGVSAGIDMALAMIEEDLGTEASKTAAQMLVVYYRRPGGQSQFSALADMEPQSERIRNVLAHIRHHLTDALTVETLASVACLSPRQFGRIFRAETGCTPAKAVERIRTEVARQKLEQGNDPVEIIARQVGYADPERMRRAFIRVTGLPPQSIRRMAANEGSH